MSEKEVNGGKSEQGAKIISFQAELAKREERLRTRRENIAKFDPNEARKLEAEKELAEIDRTLAENEKDGQALVIHGRITKEYKYRVIPEWGDKSQVGDIGKMRPFLEALEQRLVEMDLKLRNKIFKRPGACTVHQRSDAPTELTAEFRFNRLIKDGSVTVNLADKAEFTRVMSEYAKTLWF